MRKLIATICLIFASSFTVYGSGFSIYEASIRANGMMGAFSAYADHASTIYYNPAGLAKVEGIQVTGGATIISPRSSFRGPLPYSNREYEMEKQDFLVPNLYGSYQINENLTVGIGVYAPFGLGTKWEEDWVGSSTSIETELQTVFVNPAVGYTLPDFGIGKVHVGAGLMVAMAGEVKLSREVREFAVEDNIFALEGSLKQPGYGFNAGVLVEPSDDLTLGFTYRSSVEVQFEGEADFGNLPNAAFPSDAEGGTTIELPASWVAAVNYNIMDNLSAEVDYIWWGWSSYDELVINFDREIPALGGDQSVSNRDFKDTWQVRGGLEYSQFGVEGLTLRGGLAYDKNPVPTHTLDSTLPDSDRWLFSLGATYGLTPAIAIDAAYIFIRADERSSVGSEEGPQGIYNTYANLPSLGFTFNF